MLAHAFDKDEQQELPRGSRRVLLTPEGSSGPTVVAPLRDALQTRRDRAATFAPALSLGARS
jgi:hypothetical protein